MRSRSKRVEAQMIEPNPQYNSADHVHVWAGIGLWNQGQTLSIPCVDCFDEKIINPSSRKITFIENGFKQSPNGVEIKIVSQERDGISRLILREIDRDYYLDDLNISNNGRILEIGAHIGLVTIYLAKQYPQAIIDAFEPLKSNFKHLKANLAANGINANIHNFAVTGDGRDVLMKPSKQNSGGSNIYATEGEVVKSRSIQDLLHPPIELLKIDCEGAEYEIFGRMTDAEIASIGAIRGEIHRIPGQDTASLLDRLEKNCRDVIMIVRT
jgi:FkbM family methyltransferase